MSRNKQVEEISREVDYVLESLSTGQKGSVEETDTLLRRVRETMLINPESFGR